MSDVGGLEARIERLEARVAKLEHKRSGGQAILPAQTASESNVLALAGFSSLILGGAFVLRALTESQMIPHLAGAILGLTYAAFWVWRGNRVYAITAAVIAFPLIWETTARFNILSPTIANILITIYGGYFLFAAIRRNEQVLAWSGSVGAIGAAFAIGPSPATLIVISVIGAAITWFARQWEFMPWPAAIASNVVALILVVTHPPATPFVLIAYAALWLRCAVQTTIALLVGVGGATFLLIPNLQTLSIVWAAAGLIAAEISRRISRREIAIQSVIWIVAATVLMPFAGAAGIVALVRLRWREERLAALAAFLYAAFMALNIVVDVPLVRTAVLASFAVALALIGSLTGNWESSVLARVALVAGGVKLIVEDLRVGSAAIMVVAFALYGAALILVSRVSRSAARA
ncbi:MAG TPA: hypothetical protein VI391_08845 [Thermoanaerobaculia bacterium]